MLVFVAELERLFAFDPGEIGLWIDERGILELRVGGLTAERCKATGNADGRQTTCDIGRGGQARDRRAIYQDRGCSLAQRRLAGLGLRDGQAQIEDPVGAESARVANRDLLVQDALRTGSLAFQRKT